jgi:hypothetical protein
MTLDFNGLFATFSIMTLSRNHYAERHYAECHFIYSYTVECHYAVFSYATMFLATLSNKKLLGEILSNQVTLKLDLSSTDIFAL